MKFQNCIFINFERTYGRTDARTSLNNMPLQLFQSWGGDKKGCIKCAPCFLAIEEYIDNTNIQISIIAWLLGNQY